MNHDDDVRFRSPPRRELIRPSWSEDQRALARLGLGGPLLSGPDPGHGVGPGMTVEPGRCEEYYVAVSEDGVLPDPPTDVLERLSLWRGQIVRVKVETPATVNGGRVR